MDKKEKLNENTNGQIIESLAETISEANEDFLIDVVELELESIITNEAIKNIPIVKAVYGLAKTAFAIHENSMMRKTLKFIKQLNTKGLGNLEFQNYKERLKSYNKNTYKQFEYILIIIDRYIEEEKTSILANLYYSFVLNKISWDDFVEMTIIVERLFIRDIPELKNYYNNKNLTVYNINNKNSFKRLKNIDLIEEILPLNRTPDGHITLTVPKCDYEISILGKRLIECGLT